MSKDNREKVVMVVEDEKPLLQAVADKFKSKGIEVVSARTSKQAIDYLNEIKDLDVVWMDHYLLGGDSGLTILHHMKQENSPWKDLPVYVVSNTATEEKVQEYLHLGANEYFVKAESKLDDIVSAVIKDIS